MKIEIIRPLMPSRKGTIATVTRGFWLWKKAERFMCVTVSGSVAEGWQYEWVNLATGRVADSRTNRLLNEHVDAKLSPLDQLQWDN